MTTTKKEIEKDNIIDEWADIVWEGDTITPRDCIGTKTIEILKQKLKELLK